MAGQSVLVVPPFDCAWLMSDELRFAEAGRGCVVFEARAENDVTVVFKEHAGCKHYRTDTGANYTVVLGSHRNRRFKIEVDGRTVVDVAGSLLCPSLFERYWVSVHDGLITVGKGDPGKGVVHQWLDAQPNCKVRYVGLSSWDKHVGYRNIRVLPTLHPLPGAAPLDSAAGWSVQKNVGLGQFLGNPELADMHFVVGPTARLVPAHRIFLAACCTGFSDCSLLVAGQVVKLPCVEYQILRALLEFIYTGRTKVLEEEVGQLQELAREFGLSSLSSQCEEHRAAAAHFGEEEQHRMLDFLFLEDEFRDDFSASPLRIPVVVEKLKVLREREDFCDVKLLLESSGQVVQAHKLILSAWSDPFSKMFTNGMCESNQTHVTLNDVAPAPFMVMLDYMYTGQLGFGGDNGGELLLPLLVLSDQFSMESLRRKCCERLLECLTEDSVTAILQVAAELTGCEALREACEECFAKHFDYCTVPTASEFKALDENCLMRILQHPDVWVSSEERILDAVVAWGANEDGIGGWEDAESHLEKLGNLFQGRAEKLQLVLPFVRFPLMPLALLQKLMTTKLSKHLALVYELVAEAVDYLAADASSAVNERDALLYQLDVNKQGRLVKLSKSSIRFNRRLSAYKELLYMCDGDRNGVFFYAGTSYGMHPWMNPVVIKTLRVTASSPPSRYTDAKALVSRNYQGTSFASPCQEKGVISAWWKVDLGDDHQLMCSYYTVRQDGSTNFMRSWSLQGSMDGETWTNLRNHQDEQTICRPGQYASWPVHGSRAYQPFRFFRVMLTGPTSEFCHSWNLCLCYLELYGYFR